MNKLKLKWKLGLLPLYTIIILLVVFLFNTYTSIDANKLFLTPVFDDNKGWDIYIIEENGTRRDISVQELYDSSGETIYLSRVLDKKLETDGYTILELDSFTWQESVFLDNKLLYTVNPDLDNRIGYIEFPKEYSGLQGTGEYIRLSLPPDYGSKTLTIAIAFNHLADYRGLPMIRMSNEKIQTQIFINDANLLSIPATVYMIIAILLLGLFFYNWYYGQKNYSILLLVFTALVQSLRNLLNFNFYFNSNFSLNFIPAEILIPLSLAMPLLYMFMQMKRWKKWYAPFIIGPLIITLAFHIMTRFPMFFFISAYPYDVLLYISLLALLVFSILEWRDKNTVYRLFLPAVITIIISIILISFVLVVTNNNNVTFISILLSPILMLYESLQFYGNIISLLGGAIYFIQTIKKTANTQNELIILSMRNELITENIQSIQESSTEIAKMRHDMLHHLHTMLHLSYEGKTERLQKYLIELTKDTETILPIKICQHPVVNAIVTRTLMKAKKENIKMDLNVEVPANITIADSDLCILVMNMLDNAINAAASIPKAKKRFVELTMHVRGSYLFIETINSYHTSIYWNKDTGVFQSTKGPGHGYGMKSMTEVAKKYTSKLQIEQRENKIIVRTALLMPQK